eukprot:scpid104360/ scgid29227/ 
MDGCTFTRPGRSQGATRINAPLCQLTSEISTRNTVPRYTIQWSGVCSHQGKRGPRGKSSDGSEKLVMLPLAYTTNTVTYATGNASSNDPSSTYMYMVHPPVYMSSMYAAQDPEAHRPRVLKATKKAKRTNKV